MAATMAAQSAFETFAASQTGQLATGLLDEFRRCCVSEEIAQAEYAQRLRQVIEARFAEEAMSNAAARTNRA
jgi:hypothetical protein